MMAALALGPASAHPPTDREPASPPKQSVRLRIIQPRPGTTTTWYWSSKRVIEWSVSGLPSGNYAIIAYLKSLRDGKRGWILEDSAGNGRRHVQYVVGGIGYGEKDGALKNGRYALSLALYRKPDAGRKDPPELVLEKVGGTIRIKDADPDAEGGYPDDQPHR